MKEEYKFTRPIGKRKYLTDDGGSLTWLTFYPKWNMIRFSLEKAGYFDERPTLIFTLNVLVSIIGISISLFTGPWWLVLSFGLLFFVGWGQVFLRLPIRTGINECESPEWGFYVYSHVPWVPQNFVICRGKKTKHISFPWDWDWVRTSTFLTGGIWHHETKHNRKKYSSAAENEVGGYKWLETNRWAEDHLYRYTLKNDDVQEVMATIGVSEREWRWKWFKWLPWPVKKSLCVDVEFSHEVGERRGSWKGGTVGCSYPIKKGSAILKVRALEALREMEKKRKFN